MRHRLQIQLVVRAGLPDFKSSTQTTLLTIKCGFSFNLFGAMFACGYSRVRVAVFFEKLAHFLAFVVKVGVVTAKAP